MRRRALFIVPLLWCLLGASPAPAPSSPTVTVSLGNLLPAISGQSYSASVTVSPAGAAPLSGCYRFVAKGLPTGLALDPASQCATTPTATIVTHISGTPASADVVFSPQIAIDVYPVTSAAASPPPGGSPAGTVSGILPTLPQSVVPPTPATTYANSQLSSADCLTGVCWVLGQSNNPPFTNNPAPIGNAPQYDTMVDPNTHQTIHVTAGGDIYRKVGLDETPQSGYRAHGNCRKVCSSPLQQSRYVSRGGNVRN